MTPSEEANLTRAELLDRIRLAREARKEADAAFERACRDFDAHEVTMSLPSILTESVS